PAVLSPRECEDNSQGPRRVLVRRQSIDPSLDTEVRVGAPASEIIRRARARRGDLLIMGSHQVTARRGPAGWGTASYKVGICARWRILLSKHSMVPIGLSGGSGRALRTALTLAGFAVGGTAGDRGSSIARAWSSWSAGRHAVA